MSEAYVLPIATAQLIRDYMDWRVENGRSYEKTKGIK